MSAINVLPQRDAVHMMTDAAAYSRDGELRFVNLTKCIPLPTLNCVLSMVGPAEFSIMFAFRLMQEFKSLDDLVERSDRLPDIFEDIAGSTRGGDASSSLYLAGWLSKENRPAAFAVDLWTDASSHMDVVMTNSANAQAALASRGRLMEQKHLAGTPMPSAELASACRFQVFNDPNRYNAEIDLRHLIEIQRQENIEGRHWIGGKAVLTSVDARGIRQRVMHHWADDIVGEYIEPIPITDWLAWRSTLEAGQLSSVDFTGLSRLQRERLEKKARKGTLR